MKNKVYNISSLLWILILFNCSFLFSQTLDLTKKITIKAKNKSIEYVLKEIEKNTDIIFSYSSQQIDVSKKITLKAKNKSIVEVLKTLNQTADIEFNIIEKQVIIKPINKTKSLNKNSNLKNYTLSGHLYDKETGEVLIGASIFIEGTNFGTITNEYGFYSLTIPEGNYNVIYSFIGYKRTIQEIALTKNIKTTLELDFNNEILNEIIIEAEKPNAIIENNQQGEIK